MGLQLLGHIELPEHFRPGGFDHAAVHRALGRLYVAHTANAPAQIVVLASGVPAQPFTPIKARRAVLHLESTNDRQAACRARASECASNGVKTLSQA